MEISAAVVAVFLAPLLIRWSLTLANRPPEDVTKFSPSPPLRAVYPAGIVMFGWVSLYYLDLLLDAHQRANGWNWVGLLCGFLFFGMTITSWPSIVLVKPGGLNVHRLVFHKFVKWEDIEDVGSGMDGDVTIYLKGNGRIEISQFTEGRSQLKALIRKNIETRFPTN